MSLVDDVQRTLDAAGVRVEIRELAESTATASLAAAAVGAPLGSIVKSLIFMAADKPLLVLVAGDQMADGKRIARHIGVSKKKVRIARTAEVQAVTGCRPGGVPPVAHREPLRTLVDRTLSRFGTVWAAAGAPNALFPIAYTELLSLTGGEVVDIAAGGSDCSRAAEE